MSAPCGARSVDALESGQHDRISTMKSPRRLLVLVCIGILVCVLVWLVTKDFTPAYPRGVVTVHMLPRQGDSGLVKLRLTNAGRKPVVAFYFRFVCPEICHRKFFFALEQWSNEFLKLWVQNSVGRIFCCFEQAIAKGPVHHRNGRGRRGLVALSMQVSSALVPTLGNGKGRAFYFERRLDVVLPLPSTGRGKLSVAPKLFIP